jgi:ATP-dependent DNA helicase RecG
LAETAEQCSVRNLRGVGPALAQRLQKLGVNQLQDLLFVLPLRYEDRTRIVPVGALAAGMRVAAEGEVLLSEVTYRRRRQWLVRISDGTGFLTLRFFYFSAAQQRTLARGVRLRCFGELRRGPGGLEMIHPEYEFITAKTPPLAENLTPIYPTTEGVAQGRLRALINQALQRLLTEAVRDWIPAEVLAPLGLPSLKEALLYMHRPPRDASLTTLSVGRHPAQQRLAFEELLAHQLSLRQLKKKSLQESAFRLDDAQNFSSQLLQSLPFALTNAQQQVLREINADLNSERRMMRLLQGDVGCGKTIVSALAACRALGSGLQAALMAPTELLAEQHWRNFSTWFKPLNLPVALLHGSQASRTRRSALQTIASGEVSMIVGTHALFQEEVQFARLGLIIVDEQQRFGVQQRLSLQEKGRHEERLPHQLIMTATPIPRTLAMTAYADLDISVIDELPPGRTPVQTVVIPERRRDTVVARVRSVCQTGRQVYWVCPLIEESEELHYQAAEETAAALTNALPELQVGLVHGRMPTQQKEHTMQAFKAGEIHLLVATTVIEVGVDVPNASLMVIENAERMGLAQLHQLRGRVGRGAQSSACLLLYRAPLSRIARERLECLRETNDGFEIARRDLQLRGPGELLGTRQTGLAQLRVADLVRDIELLPVVQQAAELMLTSYPRHIAPLSARWLAAGERYGRV